MTDNTRQNRILLGSIALEPNRWTPSKEPFNQLIDMLAPIQAAGFQSIELWEFHVNQLSRDEVQAVASLSADLNITFPTLALYPDFLADPDDNQMYFGELLQRTDFLGVEKIKMFAGNRSASELTDSQRDESLNQIRSLIASASQYGITVSGELHQDTLCDTVDEAKRTVADLDNQMGLCFQPLNFRSTEQTIRDFDALSDSIDHIHLQGRKNDEFSSLEEADIDYRPLVDKLDAYKGDFCIEFVKGCVVASPSDFNMNEVLAAASVDRTYLQGLIR